MQNKLIGETISKDFWTLDGNRCGWLDEILEPILFRMHFSICNLPTIRRYSQRMTHRTQNYVRHWLHKGKPGGTLMALTALGEPKKTIWFSISDEQNCIRRNNDRNTFANRKLLWRLAIILYGNSLPAGVRLMFQPMLAFFIITE